MATVVRVLVVFATASCGGPPAIPPPTPRAIDPQEVFWTNLAALCGKAFDGVIAVNEGGGPAPDPFDGKILRMHVRECSDREIRIPFHVGDDHSRTWVFTRQNASLRLKHDHRHEDGSDDKLTMYGGDTIEPGTSVEQKFPTDAFSRELFVRQKSERSVPNVWVVSIVPGERYSYALTRPGRNFRVDFDLAKPVAAPPPPWGTK